MVFPLVGEKPKFSIQSKVYDAPSITTRSRSLALSVDSTTPKPSTQLSQIHADFFSGISAFICVNLCQKWV
jgi:hypothetical protein